MAVIYASYGFILGRNKNLYTYDFKMEKFLKESLILFITSTTGYFEKRPESGTLLVLDMQCTYGALSWEI